MDLLTLVRRRLILPQMRAQTKIDAIHELLDFLIDERELPHEHRAIFLEAILRREAERTTHLGSNIAMPHSLVDQLTHEVAALGLCPRGLDFGGSDPAKIIFLLVTPKSLSHRHSINVRNLAIIACNPSFRESLLAVDNVEDAVALISAQVAATGNLD